MENSKILIVDDEIKNIKLIELILKNEGCIIESALNGKEALEKAATFLPDLIFLDIMMPEMNGYEVCEKLKASPQTSHIPIIIVSALADKGHKIQGLENSANEFLTKPIDNTELLVRARNLLKIKRYENFITHSNEMLKKKVEEQTDELKRSYIDTVLRLIKVAEFKDQNTSFHIKRTSFYCKHIAECLKWSDEDIDTIFYASPMHDIGKIGIPSEILLKEFALTLEEFALMKTHTTIGYELLKNSDSKIIMMASRIALSHHEKWNGNGYPNQLKGEAIPIEGRIMILADQYDALRNRRPYKEAYDHTSTYKIITEGDGRTNPSDFDPLILKIFKETHDKFNEIFENIR